MLRDLIVECHLINKYVDETTVTKLYFPSGKVGLSGPDRAKSNCPETTHLSRVLPSPAATASDSPGGRVKKKENTRNIKTDLNRISDGKTH